MLFLSIAFVACLLPTWKNLKQRRFAYGTADLPSNQPTNLWILFCIHAHQSVLYNNFIEGSCGIRQPRDDESVSVFGGGETMHAKGWDWTHRPTRPLDSLEPTWLRKLDAPPQRMSLGQKQERALIENYYKPH